MGRRKRPHLPGAVFHLTARTLRWATLFDAPMRTAAVEALCRSVPPSQARLLAMAVMPNHLHIVVQQGERPVWELMQPLLRRLAHQLQRHHGLDGPIFWRPYAVAACFDPDHARNAIAYTNLNPVRAGLCAQPLEYEWTSHAVYCDDAAAPDLSQTTRALAPLIDPAVALPLFASAPGRRLDELRADYRRYIEWRLAADQQRHRQSRAEVPVLPLFEPSSTLPWSREYGPLFHSPVRSGEMPGEAHEKCYLPTLADVAHATLIRFAPGVRIEDVKGRYGGRSMARIRHRIVIAMMAAGFRNVAIARFLQLSESAVSKIVCAHRNRY